MPISKRRSGLATSLSGSTAAILAREFTPNLLRCRRDTHLIEGLRSRGVDVFSVSEAERNGKPDEEQLAFASEHGYALYSFNRSDFFRIHTEWVSRGRGHARIILAPQQRFSVGEQVMRLMHVRGTL